MSYLATDSLFPEWEIWSQFLEEATEGLRLDGLTESHPIEVWSKFRSCSCIVLNARCTFVCILQLWTSTSCAIFIVYTNLILSCQVDINHAGEIDEIFDAISYRKGASVIRMLQSYLGPESFQVCVFILSHHLHFSPFCLFFDAPFCCAIIDMY